MAVLALYVASAHAYSCGDVTGKLCPIGADTACTCVASNGGDKSSCMADFAKCCSEASSVSRHVLHVEHHCMLTVVAL